MTSPFSLCLFFLAMSLHGGLVTPQNPPAAPLPVPQKQVETVRPVPVVANYLITCADDFVVEVYHNGKSIPLSRRQLLEERYGATVEKISMEVHHGDWLVFNVVNNLLRWGGASYFAVAGCLAKDEFGFVSQTNTGDWCACDNLRDVDQFISEKRFMLHKAAEEITQPWSEGDSLMRAYAGDSWKGTSVWGKTRNTWIKYVVE